MNIVNELKYHYKELKDNPWYILDYFCRIPTFFLGTDRFVRNVYSKCNLLSLEETLDVLLKNPKSFVRFGDGEIKTILGGSVDFGDWGQKHDPLLQKRMKEIFKRDDVYVGLTNEYLVKSDAELKKEGLYIIWAQMRRSLAKHLKKGHTYLDAFVFRDNSGLDVRGLFDFFNTKRIVLVTGDEGSARSMKEALPETLIVTTLASNAWNGYQDVLDKIDKLIKEENLDKENTIFLLSAGPMAKVLVLDLTSRGFLAWDTGHFFRKYKEQISKLKK